MLTDLVIADALCGVALAELAEVLQSLAPRSQVRYAARRLRFPAALLEV